jgi:hypothetical protein
MAALTSYSSVDLFMSRGIHDRVSSVQGSNLDLPFRRQIDFWWAGFLLGVNSRATSPFEGDTVKFQDGSIFSSDPWRIVHLELAALAIDGQEALQNSSRVIAIAQSHANAGMRQILESLAGEARPVLTLINEIDSLISKNE